MSADIPDTSETTDSGSGLTVEKAKRIAKIEQLRADGTNPYPYRFDRSHTLAELRAQYGDLEPGTETEVRVAVAGRVMLLRLSLIHI